MLLLQSNEVDRLSQELRKWQEGSRNANEEKQEAQQQLEETKCQLDLLRDTDHKYAQLQVQHSALQRQVYVYHASFPQGGDRRLKDSFSVRCMIFLNF